MAEGGTFTMSAEHLARTLETARQRERAKIAKYLDEQADASLETDVGGMTAQRFQEAAEYVRSMGTPAKVPAAPDPLEALRDVPSGSEELPPVRHMDDFDEGVAIARNLGARGRLNL